MGDKIGGDNRGYNGGDNSNMGRAGERHYYRDGKWYRHGSNGNDVAVADLVIGAIAESLPPQHTTVIVQGAPYYYDNHHYYQQRSDGGYVVVQPPRR